MVTEGTWSVYSLRCLQDHHNHHDWRALSITSTKSRSLCLPLPPRNDPVKFSCDFNTMNRILSPAPCSHSHFVLYGRITGNVKTPLAWHGLPWCTDVDIGKLPPCVSATLNVIAAWLCGILSHQALLPYLHPNHPLQYLYPSITLLIWPLCEH